jgi:hypothetical protein
MAEADRGEAGAMAGCVRVHPLDRSLWCVRLDDRVLLVTPDEDDALQAGLAATREDRGGRRPLLLSSGTAARQLPEALRPEVERLLEGARASAS